MFGKNFCLVAKTFARIIIEYGHVIIQLEINAHAVDLDCTFYWLHVCSSKIHHDHVYLTLCKKTTLTLLVRICVIWSVYHTILFCLFQTTQPDWISGDLLTEKQRTVWRELVILSYIRDCKFSDSDAACHFCIPVLIPAILPIHSQNKWCKQGSFKMRKEFYFHLCVWTTEHSHNTMFTSLNWRTSSKLYDWNNMNFFSWDVKIPV